jgi:prepilin-type N-terminal cleavage/methylation domain-containing protein
MKQAFSLVELSIVLVILGLLTGGILTGQNLIRAAELRSIVPQLQQYQAAMQTFRGKYFAMPGDMANATAFWGEFGDAGTGSCPGTAGTGTETCNGDGDGQVGTTTDSNIENHESAQFWKQLANAGLIEGSYTGVMEGSTLKSITLGENAPAGRISNAGFSIRWMGTQSSSTSWFEGEYRNTFYFGGTSGAVLTSGGVLSAPEVWSLDKKMDDGRPGLGRVVSYESVNCATTTSYATAEYLLTGTLTECPLIFRGF